MKVGYLMAARSSCFGWGSVATGQHTDTAAEVKETSSVAAKTAGRLVDDGTHRLTCDRDRLARAPRLTNASLLFPDEDGWEPRRFIKRRFEAAVRGGVPAVEGLYGLAQVDVHALDGFMFAAEQDADFNKLLAKVVVASDSKTSYARDAIIRLTVYAAEQEVAVHLAEQGYSVEVCVTPVRKGYSLIVDGFPVQVKCVDRAEAVLEHLTQYPGISIITNVEVAADLEGMEGVFIDTELSSQGGSSHVAVTAGLNLLSEGICGSGRMMSLVVGLGRHDTAMFSKPIPNNTATTPGAGHDVVVGSLGGISTKVDALLESFAIPNGEWLCTTIAATATVGPGSAATNTLGNSGSVQVGQRAAELLVEFGEWMASVVLPGHLEMLTDRLLNNGHRQLQARTCCAAPVEMAISRLLESIEGSIRRTRRAKDYLHRTFLSDETEETIHGGWVALTYAVNIFHPEMTVRVAELYSALEAHRADVLSSSSK